MGIDLDEDFSTILRSAETFCQRSNMELVIVSVQPQKNLKIKPKAYETMDLETIINIYPQEISKKLENIATNLSQDLSISYHILSGSVESEIFSVSQSIGAKWIMIGFCKEHARSSVLPSLFRPTNFMAHSQTPMILVPDGHEIIFSDSNKIMVADGLRNSTSAIEIGIQLGMELKNSQFLHTHIEPEKNHEAIVHCVQDEAWNNNFCPDDLDISCKDAKSLTTIEHSHIEELMKDRFRACLRDKNDHLSYAVRSRFGNINSELHHLAKEENPDFLVFGGRFKTIWNALHPSVVPYNEQLKHQRPIVLAPQCEKLSFSQNLPKVSKY